MNQCAENLKLDTKYLKISATWGTS